jgi:hypothetical protein
MHQGEQVVPGLTSILPARYVTQARASIPALLAHVYPAQLTSLPAIGLHKAAGRGRDAPLSDHHLNEIVPMCTPSPILAIATQGPGSTV